MQTDGIFYDFFGDHKSPSGTPPKFKNYNCQQKRSKRCKFLPLSALHIFLFLFFTPSREEKSSSWPPHNAGCIRSPVLARLLERVNFQKKIALVKGVVGDLRRQVVGVSEGSEGWIFQRVCTYINMENFYFLFSQLLSSRFTPDASFLHPHKCYYKFLQRTRTDLNLFNLNSLIIYFSYLFSVATASWWREREFQFKFRYIYIYHLSRGFSLIS